jgi:hypothetical protein
MGEILELYMERKFDRGLGDANLGPPVGPGKSLDMGSRGRESWGSSTIYLIFHLAWKLKMAARPVTCMPFSEWLKFQKSTQK